MKACIVGVLIICTGFIEATAQTGKGNFLVGGSINFLHDKYKSDPLPPNVFGLISSSSVFTFNPTAGYFVMNNFMVGVQASMQHGWNPDYKKVKDNILTVGPMLRYYVPFGKFAAFPELAAGYGYQSQRYGNYGSPDISSTTAITKYSSFRAGAGIAWFAAPNVGIEGVVAYKKNTFDSKNDIAHGSESWLYFNVGLQFYLNRNKQVE